MPLPRFKQLPNTSSTLPPCRHWFRIRIHHFGLNTNPEPVQGFWWPKIENTDPDPLAWLNPEPKHCLSLYKLLPIGWQIPQSISWEYPFNLSVSYAVSILSLFISSALFCPHHLLPCVSDFCALLHTFLLRMHFDSSLRWKGSSWLLIFHHHPPGLSETPRRHFWTP